MIKTYQLLPLAFALCLNVNAKEIAITFDDAPLAGSHIMTGEEKSKRIREHLITAKVPDALFFVTTNNIRQASDKLRLKTYTQAGFHLAHHSHSHLSANKVDTEIYLLDFDLADKTLKQYDGVVKYHRFPYLHYGETPKKRKAIAQHLTSKGYRFGYVTIDNFDWYINAKLLRAQSQELRVDYHQLGQLYVDTLLESMAFYDNLAQQHLGRSPKHILLLHENEVAALYLDKLIQAIRAKGWQVISPQEAYKDPIASRYNPESFNFNKQGRVAALLHHKGVDKHKLRHQSENTDFLDRRFEQYQVFTQKNHPGSDKK